MDLRQRPLRSSLHRQPGPPHRAVGAQRCYRQTRRSDLGGCAQGDCFAIESGQWISGRTRGGPPFERRPVYLQQTCYRTRRTRRAQLAHGRRRPDSKSRHRRRIEFPQRARRHNDHRRRVRSRRRSAGVVVASQTGSGARRNFVRGQRQTDEVGSLRQTKDYLRIRRRGECRERIGRGGGAGRESGDPVRRRGDGFRRERRAGGCVRESTDQFETRRQAEQRFDCDVGRRQHAGRVGYGRAPDRRDSARLRGVADRCDRSCWRWNQIAQGRFHDCFRIISHGHRASRRCGAACAGVHRARRHVHQRRAARAKVLSRRSPHGAKPRRLANLFADGRACGAGQGEAERGGGDG